MSESDAAVKGNTQTQLNGSDYVIAQDTPASLSLRSGRGCGVNDRDEGVVCNVVTRVLVVTPSPAPGLGTNLKTLATPQP